GAPPLKLVVIDVLRAAVEGDENSSEVAGSAMLAASVIARMMGVTMLLVHHAGHSDKERGRGSSAFHGAYDFCGAVSMDGRDIALKVTKNKGGPGGDILRWRLAERGVLEPGAASPPAMDAGMIEQCALRSG